MTAERAVKFVIAASIALAIMSFQAWWRTDNWVPSTSVSGLDVDALTPADGAIVLAGSAVAAGLALLALVLPKARALAGLAIALVGLLLLGITVYDLVSLPAPLGESILSLVNTGLNGDFHATPILYFAALTSFLIALAGATMALAPPDEAGQEQLDEGATAWA